MSMPGDEVRARYLRDRVLTATPAQRVVMLYDRLGLDLMRAADTQDVFVAGQQLSHAMEVVAELRASLDVTAGGPAENLASIYGYLLGELVAARGGDTDRLAALRPIVSSLRDAWAQAGELAAAASAPASAAAASNWVG
jgi:flagellar protein FliS